jgi:hypothetical protein
MRRSWQKIKAAQTPPFHQMWIPYFVMRFQKATRLTPNILKTSGWLPLVFFNARINLSRFSFHDVSRLAWMVTAWTFWVRVNGMYMTAIGYQTNNVNGTYKSYFSFNPSKMLDHVGWVERSVTHHEAPEKERLELNIGQQNIQLLYCPEPSSVFIKSIKFKCLFPLCLNQKNHPFFCKRRIY